MAGLPTHGKYNGSYEEMVRRITSVLPKRDRQSATADLFKSIPLSMRLGNGDAHLKNFGVLYDKPGDARLAPAYDIVTTTVYLPHDLPALSIRGAKNWPNDDELIRFARSVGLSRPDALRILDDVDYGIEEAAMELSCYADDHPDHRRTCDALLEKWGCENELVACPR